MKFKILKGTKLFEELTELQKRRKEANDAALKLVQSLGYESFRPKGFQTLAGGISSILIPIGKPDGWKKSGDKNEFMPAKLKKNKELLDKIAALPLVHDSELNDLIKYDWRKHEGNRIQFVPNTNWFKDYILINVQEYMTKYKPVPGMIEILESEYQKLIKSKK